MMWQPIETAPRDGAHFDIWCIEAWGGFRVTDCKWGCDAYTGAEGIMEFLADDSEPWRFSWEISKRNATHWMPLPEPPA